MASFDRPTDTNIPASPWVIRFADLIKPSGRVLDLAAGHGRHSRFMVSRGFTVTAIDIDASALADFGSHEVEVIERDLESEPWLFDPATYDGIVITNYLHRPLFPDLAEALAPDGVLIIETFGAGNEEFGRPRNPDFLLQPGELLEAFSGRLNIVAYEHGIEHTPRSAVRQRLCAVKAETPRAL